MIGCGCVDAGKGLAGLPIVDTTSCPIHPLTCDAVCPETGIGCHHDVGHDSGIHSYVVNVSWEQGSPAESVIL